MISKVRPAFWRRYASLSSEAKTRAREAYALFAEAPQHPSLRFKKLRASANLWSVRINDQYRAVGVRQGDTIEWIWIGTHNEFDKQFS